MGKRLIVCCDGTWQDLFYRRNQCPTNVVKIGQAIKPIDAQGTQQIVYYSEGIGVANGLDRVFGGAFGWGIDKRIQDAYLFLCFNYEEGDEIYLFGFSRGAYTARSLAGLIYKCGLLPREAICETGAAYQFYRNAVRPSNAEAKDFREDHGTKQVQIELLCCWDTVGSLGLPTTFGFISKWINRKYEFHDCRINRKIKNALHAVAIDERREAFKPAFMWPSDEGADTKISQVCFVGDHGSVGGGSQNHIGLSDITLQWVIDKIKQDYQLGLEFYSGEELEQVVGYQLKPDPLQELTIKTKWLYRLTGLEDRNFFVDAPQGKRGTKKIEPDETFFKLNIHPSVRERWQQFSKKPRPYQPGALEPLRKYFEADSPN